MLRMLLLAALLYSQVHADVDLERERRAALPSAPRTIMLVVKAEYPDGRPARGYINCDGIWCKYGGRLPGPVDDGENTEPDACLPNYPFKTDARGACVFNPSHDWLTQDGEDTQMRCTAAVGLKRASITFYPVDGKVYTIVVPE